MKKLFRISSIIFMLSVLTGIQSCDELIDKQPLGDTEATFFTTQDAFDRGIQGIYSKITDWYWYHANDPIYDFWLLPGDDLTTRQANNFETFAALQPGNGHVGYYWSTAYQLIGRSNTMLEKIEEVEEGVYMEENLKSYHKGEALFLRALAFYRLWSFFGTGPITLERIRQLGEETQQPGSTGTQMLDQAIEDLEEAAGLLPSEWEDKFIGRVTKDGAYGLLGKCLVTRACYGGGSADYNAAITAFNNISSKIALTPHFGSNFDAMDENNEESLFEFQASNAPSFNNIWLGNDFNQQIGAMEAYWGFFNDAWSFWAHTPYVPTQKLRNMFEEGDPRIAETFKENSGSNYNGWEFIKYTKRNKEGDNTSSLNNPRILRYADILLLKAEAYLQTQKPNDALAAVNAVRKRARESVADGEPVSTVPADLTTVSMQDIMNERMRELCGEEGHRFLDLKRWHAAGYINLANWNADAWGPSLREDFNFQGWLSDTQGDMLYPIPRSEMDLNPNMNQNNGY
jgi:starch-binding outer membrane protein, SusD/RagB family